MTVRLARKFFLLPLLGLFCSVTMMSGLAHAQPSVSSSEPNVLIAIDVTASAKVCTETFTTNIRTSHQSTKTVACPAGSLTGDKVVPLHVAVMQHKKYVVLPTSLSATFWKTHAFQIQQLQKGVQPAVQSSIHPLTGCGNQSAISMRWNLPNWFKVNTTVDTSVTYFRTSDCQVVDFFSSSVSEEASSQVDVTWCYDLYAGNQFITDTNPDLFAGEGYTMDWNANTNTPGYTYENWLFDACGETDASVHNDMGPID